MKMAKNIRLTIIPFPGTSLVLLEVIKGISYLFKAPPVVNCIPIIDKFLITAIVMPSSFWNA